jgi:hypothetical protein
MARTVTISDLQYKLSLNAKDLDANAIASRTELNYTNRALHELRTPMERYEKDLRDAEQLLKFGEAGQELYNRKLAQAEKRLRDASGETARLKKEQDDLNDEMQRANRLIDKHTDHNHKLQQEMRDVSQLYRRGRIDLRTYELEMSRLNNEMRKTPTLLQAIGQKVGASFGLDAIFGSAGSGVVGQIALIGAAVQVADRLGQSVQRGVQFAASRVQADLAEIDKIAKSARALNLELDELMGLQFAFGLGAGLDADQTTQLLVEVTKRSSEASKGIGESMLAFKELNLEASELARLSPDEQLFKIADAMQDVELRSDRLRIAGKLFGEEQGKAFIALEGGADGLRDAISRSEQLGIGLTDADAKRVEDLNDAMASVAMSFAAVSRMFTVEAADDLKEVVDLVGELAIITLENRETILMLFDNVVVSKIRDVANAMRGLNAITEIGLDQIKTYASGFDSIFGTSFLESIDRPDDKAEKPIEQKAIGNMQAARTDPSQSIVAGSREAFNVTFQNEVRSQMQIAQQQLAATREGVNVQRDMVAALNTVADRLPRQAEAFI